MKGFEAEGPSARDRGEGGVAGRLRLVDAGEEEAARGADGKRAALQRRVDSWGVVSSRIDRRPGEEKRGEGLERGGRLDGEKEGIVDGEPSAGREGEGGRQRVALRARWGRLRVEEGKKRRKGARGDEGESTKEHRTDVREEALEVARRQQSDEVDGLHGEMMPQTPSSKQGSVIGSTPRSERGPLPMKRKVDGISNDLAARLAALPGVDCIVLAETVGDDLVDPYFFFSLDVYYRGALPDEEERRKLFSDAGAFESSSYAAKDRFLIDDLPVRVEYKDIARVDTILGRIERNLWVFRQTGTYMFYRLENGTILTAQTEWIKKTRETLKKLPESFFDLLAASSRATMEHYLSDYAAAVVRQDQLFSLVSAAGFIKSCCSTLFVINRRFEPSGRLLTERVTALPLLPEHFKARFESFLSDDPDFTPARKREIAEHIAASIGRMIESSHQI